ncbi:MAG: hypothetical protein B6245_08470 [Desulfobacteraceae bacterium 4572_88]|nr:MAG: hypothetical protein B6245_08470 [Desulfobacteraceae bacterium 4572_88]RLC06289.1 MAG: hypothetical protein DRI57_26950 [Deltaproteobacteria bacterium]
MQRPVIYLIIWGCLLFFSLTAFAQQEQTPLEPPPAPENPGVKEPSPPEQNQPQSQGQQDQEKTVQMKDIHDIRPPEKIEVDLRPLYYALAGILALLLCVAAFLYLRKYLKKLRKKEIITLSPDEAAFRSLDALGDVESLDGKEFYFELSAILRNYIQGRYEISAPEMTTEELLPRIEKLKLSQELRKSLRDLLQSADPVKFAGCPTVQNKMQRDLNFVHVFVKQTTQEPAAP